MSSTTAQQRRGKVAISRPDMTIASTLQEQRNSDSDVVDPLLSSSSSNVSIPHLSLQTPSVALVRRRFCGTGPFDRHWLNVDCCGLFCAFLTYFLHLYAIYVVRFILIPPWMSYRVDDVNSTLSMGDQRSNTQKSEATRFLTVWGHLHSFAFTAVATLAMVSHFRAMTTDPGAVPPDAKPIPTELNQWQQSENVNTLNKQVLDPHAPSAGELGTLSPKDLPPQPALRLCRRCKAFKPQRAHHCSVCRRCIIKMDHHCPWINNCCAVGNHKFFLLFVFYTFFSCIYSLSLVVLRFATCMGSAHHHRGRELPHQSCLDTPADLLSILALLIEALLFGMFTSCMMCDQVSVVNTRMTHIDRLKGLELGGSLSGWAEVFGIGPPRTRQGLSASAFTASAQSSQFRLDWLFPWGNVCWDGLETEILGFCRPASSTKSSSMKDASTNRLEPDLRYPRVPQHRSVHKFSQETV